MWMDRLGSLSRENWQIYQVGNTNCFASKIYPGILWGFACISVLQCVITSSKLILCSCIVGLEASITDSNEISAILTDAKVVAEAREENKIQVSMHEKLIPM